MTARCQLAIAAIAATWLAVACTGSSVSEPLPPLPSKTAASEPPRGPERPTRELSIALVGEVRGEIEPCGCPTLPYGGFTRRQRALDQLRKRGTLFHLDAGELLLKGDSAAGRSQQDERAAALLDLSKAVGVDAWAPGPTDLMALGAAGIAALRVPPAVSANWTTPDGAPLLPASVVIERDGLRLAVIGLSGEVTDPAQRDQVLTLDPVEAARAAIDALPSDVDLVVGLGSLAGEDAERVAALPGIAAVLATRGPSFDDPRPGVGPSAGLVIEAPDRGRYIEVVDLRLGSTAGAPLQALPEEQAWRELLSARQQTPREGGQSGLDAIESRFAEVGRGRNLAHAAAMPLAAQLDGPAAVDARIAAFKASSLEGAAERAAAPPADTEPGYAASGPCLNCHTTEFSRWSLTSHAGAWQPLVDRNAVTNPECLACHTTGFGEPGGFGEPTGANLRKFKAVQCESCHGPMQGHPDDGTVVGRPITEQTCLPCHDQANSPQFDYVPYLRRSTCQDADNIGRP